MSDGPRADAGQRAGVGEPEPGSRDEVRIALLRRPHGGHFAAFEQPELFAAELRAFFRLVR